MSDDAPDLGYAGLDLDRTAERRDDEAFLAEAARDPAARTAVLLGDRPVLKVGADSALDLMFEAHELAGLGPVETVAFLGRAGSAPRFAARLGEGAEENVARADNLVTGDLRALGSDGRLAGQALALAGYAKSMAAWHARHGFCGDCGTATAPNASGWRRSCPSCGALHFPRVDPVVIMLVTHRGRCLLGRQSRFPLGMWSCLAGFVEPGETIEDAAKREIEEEAGVGLGAVTYEMSQPWPFPSQLMIGVSAEAMSDALTPDLDELDDARWFGHEDVEAMLAKNHPDGLFAPPPAAIAHHLLRRFLAR